MSQKRIASVTAALHAIVEGAVSEAMAGAVTRIGLSRPAEPGAPEAWLHLYRLGAAAAARNLPTRRGAGAARSRTSVDLHYLIGFAAEEPLAAELMLEKVLVAIESGPVLGAAQIEAGVRNFSSLADSGLAFQAEPVRLILSYPPPDESARMWMGLQPSLQVTASPVLLDHDRSA
ncbi:MAG TPA: Pvc16 family protein [Allosphingosinicella sp.]